ncbi:Lrp/AsnC ligand binding domain-containing protein [Nocardioides sp.]|uniref:Lrp/AsnC family transcriptional regulator n=1 Tax=Nocardioides sp. TaxID=35761 RepID=UPI002635C809|nr:Lrp/AsnC ligand binding domain-containing protein [Nocardioides sp.]
MTPTTLDEIDIALLSALTEVPRAGDLELSRRTKVARATVQARLRRLAEAGVIADWSPRIDVAAAGFEVQAYVTLEIAQGALDQVVADLTAIPQVLEAYGTTGTFDVLCRVATRSLPELQETLVRIDTSSPVARSTSVMVLSVLIPPRTVPLLRAGTPAPSPRSPAYRGGRDSANGPRQGV